VQIGGNEIVARLERQGDRPVEVADPLAVFLVRLILDLLAEGVGPVPAAEPAMSVADKAKNRLLTVRPYAHDHHP
jgi:hypothetical protein